MLSQRWRRGTFGGKNDRLGSPTEVVASRLRRVHCVDGSWPILVGVQETNGPLFFRMSLVSTNQPPNDGSGVRGTLVTLGRSSCGPAS